MSKRDGGFVVAFGSSRAIIHVRDRRRIAIRSRRRDGPRNVHPYHVQVNGISKNPPIRRHWHSSLTPPPPFFFLFCIFRANPQSIAFLLYTHIVFLITLYATSGRNASDAAPAMMKDGRAARVGAPAHAHARAPGAIELTATPTRAAASQGAWYSRVRTEDPMHVIGEEDEEDEDGDL
jgi:hypothetical protein